WSLVIDSSFCFIFFFQAEDGIRDRNVTGVQTCALPISITFFRGNSYIFSHCHMDKVRYVQLILFSHMVFSNFSSFPHHPTLLGYLSPLLLSLISLVFVDLKRTRLISSHVSISFVFFSFI